MVSAKKINIVTVQCRFGFSCCILLYLRAIIFASYLLRWLNILCNIYRPLLSIVPNSESFSDLVTIDSTVGSWVTGRVPHPLFSTLKIIILIITLIISNCYPWTEVKNKYYSFERVVLYLTLKLRHIHTYCTNARKQDSGSMWIVFKKEV